MEAVDTDAERLDPEHRRHWEDRVEMREEIAAARRLVAEVGAKTVGVDRTDDQALDAGEMEAERFGKLRGGREVDVAVRLIDGDLPRQALE